MAETTLHSEASPVAAPGSTLHVQTVSTLALGWVEADGRPAADVVLELARGEGELVGERAFANRRVELPGDLRVRRSR